MPFLPIPQGRNQAERDCDDGGIKVKGGRITHAFCNDTLPEIPVAGAAFVLVVFAVRFLVPQTQVRQIE